MADSGGVVVVVAVLQTGFHVQRTPPQLWQKIQAFYRDNAHKVRLIDHTGPHDPVVWV